MIGLTLGEAKSYIRSKVKELKNDEIHDKMLTVDFNLAQDRVQTDLMQIGIKEFTKQTILEGSIVDVPSDLQMIPNAIKDIRASTGVRATNTTENNTYTAIEPGTNGNNIQVVTEDDGGDASLTGVVSVSGSGTATDIFIIHVYVDSGVTTNIELQTAIQGNPIANELVEVTNDTGGMVTAQTISLSGGTGTGWYGCDEVGIDKFNRISGDYIQDPSATFPKYRLLGDRSGSKIIEVLPRTITWLYIVYWYMLAEMTLDADNLGLPEQYQELALIEVERKQRQTLNQKAQADDKKLDYEKKLSELRNQYERTAKSETADKERIQTTDVGN